MNVTFTGDAADTVRRYAREQGWTEAEALASIMDQAAKYLDHGLLAPEVEDGEDARVFPIDVGVTVH